MTATDRRQARVVAARPRARLALDAFLVGQSNSDEITKLVLLALADYRIRYPSCPATETWLFYDGDPTTERILDNAERVDVYCLFCRVLLLGNARLDVDYSPRVHKHTTVCALRCLAGELEPGAPHTYRLPETA